MKVTIAAISDTHGKHRQLTIPRADILVHCGDFMVNGTDFREIIDFNFWLEEQPVKARLVIAGNHDMLFQKAPYFSRSFLSNAIYLEEEGVTLLGLRFWGSPYTPEFQGWGFMEPRGEGMRRHWAKIPSQLDVLVVHGPPKGYLDVIETHHKGGKGHPPHVEREHVGCGDLREAILKRDIPLAMFGHIHAGYGEAMLGKTRLLNVASLNEKGKPRPVNLIEIDV